MEKYRIVSEVARQLEIELQINISDHKIRRWENEGIVQVDRGTNKDERLFDEHDYARLRLTAIMNELGISLHTIKEYLDNPANPKVVAHIFKRSATMRELLRKLEKYLGGQTFQSL